VDLEKRGLETSKPIEITCHAKTLRQTTDVKSAFLPSVRTVYPWAAYSSIPMTEVECCCERLYLTTQFYGVSKSNRTAEIPSVLLLSLITADALVPGPKPLTNLEKKNKYRATFT
jgi:hypothetical protein